MSSPAFDAGPQAESPSSTGAGAQLGLNAVFGETVVGAQDNPPTALDRRRQADLTAAGDALKDPAPTVFPLSAVVLAVADLGPSPMRDAGSAQNSQSLDMEPQLWRRPAPGPIGSAIDALPALGNPAGLEEIDALEKQPLPAGENATQQPEQRSFLSLAPEAQPPTELATRYADLPATAGALVAEPLDGAPQIGTQAGNFAPQAPVEDRAQAGSPPPEAAFWVRVALPSAQPPTPPTPAARLELSQAPQTPLAALEGMPPALLSNSHGAQPSADTPAAHLKTSREETVWQPQWARQAAGCVAASRQEAALPESRLRWAERPLAVESPSGAGLKEFKAAAGPEAQRPETDGFSRQAAGPRRFFAPEAMAEAVNEADAADQGRQSRAEPTPLPALRAEVIQGWSAGKGFEREAATEAAETLTAQASAAAPPDKPAHETFAEAKPVKLASQGMRFPVPASPAQARLELRIAERAGALQVSVHTADAALRRSLQGELSQLVSALKQRGLEATAQPAFDHLGATEKAAGESFTTDTELHAPTQDDSGRAQADGERHPRQQTVPWEDVLLGKRKPTAARPEAWAAALKETQWSQHD